VLSFILYINSLSPSVTGRSACVFYGRTGPAYNWPPATIFYGRTGPCTDGNLPGTLPVFTVIANTSTIRLLVLITVFLNLLFSRTDLRRSVCRGPETQIPTVRLSRSWNPVSVYRGLETQVLRARHGRIVSDRHGYPLVIISYEMSKRVELATCHTLPQKHTEERIGLG
jgi:hypothetical protein